MQFQKEMVNASIIMFVACPRCQIYGYRVNNLTMISMWQQLPDSLRSHVACLKLYHSNPRIWFLAASPTWSLLLIVPHPAFMEALNVDTEDNL